MSPAYEGGSNGYSMGHGGHGGHGGAIPAAIKSRQSVEIRNVNDISEPIRPQLIEVGAQQLPLTIHFRSTSSNIKVLSSHQPGYGDTQQTSSQDEAHKLFHEVNKPIIQEVREVITPYRRIVQEIRPVQEDIQTIVAKSSSGRGGGGNHYGGGHTMPYGGSSGHKY